MRVRQQVSKKLAIENLEPRAMLAGDVTVSVVQGSIKISGDVQGNEIAVTDLGGGLVEVAGQNGTTINGQAGPLSFPGVQSGVKINLKDGNDIVSFKGNSLHVLTRVSIETGAGTDTVSVDDVFANHLKVETGSDDDVVNVLDVTGLVAKFETGSGNDTVNLGNPLLQADATVKALELEVETGRGDDTVLVRDAIFQTLEAEIETGSGNDTVSIDDLQAQGKFEVETGSGTDSVAILASLFAKLEVELGSGDNDQLSITNSVASKTKLDGGFGIGDTLTLSGSTLGTTKTKGFEVIV